MGSLFTTAGGTELTGITSGTCFLDFMAGTVTLPDGSVSNMNKNLNDLGLNQCNSIGVWCSDADEFRINVVKFQLTQQQLKLLQIATLSIFQSTLEHTINF